MGSCVCVWCIFQCAAAMQRPESSSRRYLWFKWLPQMGTFFLIGVIGQFATCRSLAWQLACSEQMEACVWAKRMSVLDEAERFHLPKSACTAAVGSWRMHRCVPWKPWAVVLSLVIPAGLPESSHKEFPGFLAYTRQPCRPQYSRRYVGNIRWSCIFNAQIPAVDKNNPDFIQTGNHVYAWVSVCMLYLKRPEEGVSFPGAGLKDSC